MSRFTQAFKVFGLLGLFLFIVACCRLPWEPSPEDVIRNMGEAMASLESVALNPATIIAKGKFVDPGDYDDLVTGDQPEPTVNGVLTLNITGQSETFYKTNVPDYALVTDATLDMNGKTYPFSFESRGKGSLVYMNFLTLPGVAKELVDLSGLTNQWWELPREQAPSFYSPVPQAPQQEQQDVEEPEELTEEQIADLERLIEDTRLVSIVEDFGKEKCENGKTAYHFKVKVDEKAAKEFFITYHEILGDSYTADELDAFEELVKALAQMDTDLWIQKKDYFLCKITAVGDYKSSENGQTYTINLTANLADHNEEFEVARPEEATPLTADNILKALGIDVKNIFGSLEESLNAGTLEEDLNEELDSLKNEFKGLFEE